MSPNMISHPKVHRLRYLKNREPRRIFPHKIEVLVVAKVRERLELSKQRYKSLFGEVQSQESK
jgi:hypothetical protein